MFNVRGKFAYFFPKILNPEFGKKPEQATFFGYICVVSPGEEVDNSADCSVYKKQTDNESPTNLIQPAFSFI